MVRRRLGAALALVLGAPALACSLAISTDGLAGPPLEPDAAPDAEIVADAGSEAAAPDAADAADAGFCERHSTATFCADWDGDPDPEKGFVEVAEGDHSYALSGDAVTPPHSLLTTASASGSAGTSARLYRDLAFIAKAVHLELDAKICDPGSGGVELLKIETSSVGTHDVKPGFESADVALGTDNGQSAMALEYYASTGDQSKGYALDEPLPTGAWTHLALDVVFTTDVTGSVAITVDGKPAKSITNVRTLSDAPTAMRVLIGAFTSSDSNPCTNLVDNLLVEATP